MAHQFGGSGGQSGVATAAAIGIETGDQQQAGGVGIQAEQGEIGAVCAQDRQQLPHIAGPGAGAAPAAGLDGMAGVDVVDHDQAPGGHVPLGVEQIAQGELKQVHAIDEGQLGCGLEQRGGLLREEGITAAGHDPGGGRQINAHAEIRTRVDADGRAGGAGQADALIHADF